MVNLRDSSNKDGVKGLLDTLWSDLLDVEESYAKSYLKWCTDKLKINKSHRRELELRGKSRRTELSVEEKKELSGVAHKNLPRGIAPWDIVHINFGLNVGDELSDIDKNDDSIAGHYGIIVKQLGFLFLVIPLTSQKPRGQSHEIILKDLGLPGTPTDSHVAFNKIRTVHIRRIQRIHSIKNGKVTITDDGVKKVVQAALTEMCGLNIEEKGNKCE